MGTYLTKGTTFTTGDTVTAGALNNLVDNATVTAGSIGSAELAANSVTADKISTVSPQPVTTNTIRDNAIDNSKLNNMGSQTVKLNATNGSADPQDLGMIGGGTNGSSKILIGTSDSLNVLTASQFKMVDSASTPTAFADATDSTATHLRLNTTAVSDWDTVAAATDVHDDDDRFLLYDADGVSASVASLKQISPKKLIQSLPATILGTGVVKIATGDELSEPFDSTHTTELALSPKGTINCPIFAKAWATISTDLASTAATGNTSLDSSFNIGTEQLSGVLVSGTTYKIIEFIAGDNFTNIGGTNVTGNQFEASGTTPTTWTNSSRLVPVPKLSAQGVIPFTFSVSPPTSNYMVMVTCAYGNLTSDTVGTARVIVSSATTGGFTLNFYDYAAGVRTPRSVQIVVFGT